MENDPEEELDLAPAPVPRRRPITAWPLIFYDEDGDKAEGDVLWPLFRYLKMGDKRNYSLRPLLLSIKTDKQTLDIAAVLHLFQLHSAPSERNLVVHPLLLRLRWGFEEEYDSASRGLLSAFDLRILWRVLVFSWARESLHFALHPFCLSVTRTPEELLWYLFFGTVFYSALVREVESSRSVVRHFRVLPLLFFHKAITVEQHEGGLVKEGYTVLAPVYWNIYSATTSRFHIWPLLGIQSFDQGAIREYSIVYPFFRLELENRTNEEALEDVKQATTLHMLWPLFRARIENEGARKSLSHRLLPFYTYTSESDSTSSSGNDVRSSRTHGYFLLFYWDASSARISSSGEKEAEEDSEAELVERNRKYGIVPIVHYRDDTDTRSLAIYPLLSFFHSARLVDIDTSDAFYEWSLMILPLLSYYSQGQGSSSLISPFVCYRNAPTADIVAIPLILYYNSSQPNGRSFTTALASYVSSSDGQSWRSAILPLYYASSDGTFVRRFLLFPPFYSCEGAGYQLYVTITLPLYCSHRDGQRSFDLLSPFWVAFHTPTHDLSAYGVIPLLFYIHATGPTTSITGVSPFYLHYADTATNDSVRMITPFVWQGQVPASNLQWRVVAPFYVNAQSPTRHSFLLFPLYFITRDLSGGGVPGSYVKWVTPLYFDFNANPNDPNLWMRHRVEGLLPCIWFRVTTSAESHIVMPLITLLSFYYYHHDNTNNNYERVFCCIPAFIFFFSMWDSTTGRDCQSLLPWFHRSHSVTHTTLWFLPACFLLHDDRRNGRRVLVATPFVVQRDDYQSGTSFSMIAPVYLRWSSPVRGIVFFTPLVMDYQDLAMRIFGIVPLFLSVSSPSLRLLLCPLFISSKQPTNGTTLLLSPVLIDFFRPSDQSHLRIVPPLYLSYTKTGANDDETNDSPSDRLGLRILLPFYFSLWKGEKEISLRVILPFLVWYERAGCGGLHAIFPFYIHSYNEIEGKSLTYYFPFYGVSTYQPSPSSPIAYRRHFVLFPLYSRTQTEEAVSYDIAWPLVRYEASNELQSVRVLPLLLHRSHAAGEGLCYTIAAPLYYSFWWRKEASEMSRFRLLFPFLIQWNDPTRGNYYLGSMGFLPPYVYYHRYPGTGGTQRTVLHIWPVYGHGTEGTSSWSYVLWPLVSAESNDELTFWRVASAFYRSYETLDTRSATKSSSSSWGLLPLWIHHAHTRELLLDTPSEAEPERVMKKVKDVSFLLHWYQQVEERHEGREPAVTTDLSVGWLLHPSFALSRYHHATEPEEELMHYVAPLYHYQSNSATAARALSIGFLLHPTLSLVHLRSDPQVSVFRVLPLIDYKHNKTSGLRQFSALYFLFPRLALIRALSYPQQEKGLERDDSDEHDTSVSYYRYHHIAPLWYYENNPALDTCRWSILWLLRGSIGLLTWRREQAEKEFTASMLFNYLQKSDLLRLSFLYILHPEFSLVKWKRISDRSPSASLLHYLMPLYHYYQGQDMSTWSVGWLLSPRISIIRFEQWAERLKHYAMPLYYWSRNAKDGSSFLSFLWLFHPSAAMFRYKRDPSHTSHSIPALYSYTHDHDKMCTHFKSLLGLFKWSWSPSSTESSLFPLYHYQRDKVRNETKFKLLLGLFKYSSGQMSNLWLWPLLKCSIGPAGALDLALLWCFSPILSVFRFIKSVEGRYIRMWPFIRHEKINTDTERSSSTAIGWLVPSLALYRYFKNSERTTHALWPIYRVVRQGGEGVLSLLQILWLLPGFSIFRYAPQGKTIRHSLWPFYSLERNTERKTIDLKILWRLGRFYQHSGGLRWFLNPFIYHETDHRGSYSAFLGGLIARETSPEGQGRMRWLWVF